MSINYFRGYVVCQATAPVSCPFGYPMTPNCDPLAQTINNCLTRNPPSGF